MNAQDVAWRRIADDLAEALFRLLHLDDAEIAGRALAAYEVAALTDGPAAGTAEGGVAAPQAVEPGRISSLSDQAPAHSGGEVERD